MASLGGLLDSLNSDSGLGAADFGQPDKIIQLGMAPIRIDIVTGIDAVTFADAWKSRAVTDMDGLKVNVIGRELLLKNKIACGRSFQGSIAHIK